MSVTYVEETIITCDDCQKKVTYLGKIRFGDLASPVWKSSWRIDRASQTVRCIECEHARQIKEVGAIII